MRESLGERSPRKPFLLHAIGQSELSAQPRFKGWGNRLHLLMGGTAKSLCMGINPGRFDSLCRGAGGAF